MAGTPEQRKRYRETHKEQIAAAKKQWKIDNPDKVAAGRKRYKETHPDKVAESRKRYKIAHPDVVKAEHKRWKKTLTGKRMMRHDFIAIDGEGWNTGDVHNYHMIVTSDPTLYISREKPLTTVQCLDFIGSLQPEKNQHIVSFFFDYDVTMILRDLTLEAPELAAKLFDLDAQAHYVWWNKYGIKYMPHKHLTIKHPSYKKPVTIHDTQGFFQSSFIVALTKFDIGTPEQRDAIGSMKQQRSTFTASDRREILEYSQQECVMLVKLAEKIRDLSHAVKLNPYPYEGPGGLASRAMARHYGRNVHAETIDTMPADVAMRLPWTMYGGRFETLACGYIPTTVFEFDRHSAYPAIMADLPCMRHGQWVKGNADARYAFAHVDFWNTTEPDYGVAYPLPIRKNTGVLYFPQTGSGWYWQHEYQNIPGLTVSVSDRWYWKPDGCNCQPFQWARDMFAERERMEAEHKGSGIALKLTLNTLYGKSAQTRPKVGPWCNFAYASIITSTLRRDMYNLYLQCEPMTAFMFATDAIFTSSKLPVSHGLGGLELADTYNDLTIVQPGMYFDGRNAHFKTRGIPKKYVKQYADEICVSAAVGADYRMDITQFTGMRLGLSTGNLDKIGNWNRTTRTISTRPLTKRSYPTVINGISYTSPIANSNKDGESVKRKIGDADMTRMLSDFNSDDEIESECD